MRRAVHSAHAVQLGREASNKVNASRAAGMQTKVVLGVQSDDRNEKILNQNDKIPKTYSLEIVLNSRKTASKILKVRLLKAQTIYQFIDVILVQKWNFDVCANISSEIFW